MKSKGLAFYLGAALLMGPVYADETVRPWLQSEECEECRAGVFAVLSHGEKSFFSECPVWSAQPIHRQDSYWDPHALFYTATSVTEIEVLRAADWLIDLTIPGSAKRPFRSTVEGIRHGYAKLPRWLVLRRMGELIDAFQLPELSLGDASSAYDVASGSAGSIGGGTLYRANLLIDWTQHVVGDVNRGPGFLVGRKQGFVPSKPVANVVDSAQWVFTKVLNQASVIVSRSLEGLIEVVEDTTEFFIKAATRTPHHESTVFVRLPVEVYRAYELWVLEHQNKIFVGRKKDFIYATHAQLMHDGSHLDLALHDSVMVEDGEDIFLMTDQRTFLSAPKDLRAYVVPSLWVLHEHAKEE